jgi:sulfur relay (sulfurtransferase) complex TusBCD TusD component (DsrE family)
MSNYIFIETRDRFESRDVRFVEENALALKHRGHQVTIFFVQNGVLATRQKCSSHEFARLSDAGVILLADDFSLAERGITTAELNDKIQPAPIQRLVTALVQENTKAMWH